MEWNGLQTSAVLCLYSVIITLLLSGPVLLQADVKEQNKSVKQEDMRAGFGEYSNNTLAPKYANGAYLL